MSFCRICSACLFNINLCLNDPLLSCCAFTFLYIISLLRPKLGLLSLCPPSSAGCNAALNGNAHLINNIHIWQDNLNICEHSVQPFQQITPVTAHSGCRGQSVTGGRGAYNGTISSLISSYPFIPPCHLNWCDLLTSSCAPMIQLSV